MAENPRAFPSGDFAGCEPSYGMGLRDYFAVHADQPGISEIVSMAGFQTDGFWVFLGGDGENKQTFNDWWNNLPLTERLSLSARVRFAMADALLSARTPEASDTGEGKS